VIPDPRYFSYWYLNHCQRTGYVTHQLSCCNLCSRCVRTFMFCYYICPTNAQYMLTIICCFITSFWITSTRYSVQPACRFLLRRGYTNTQLADFNTYRQTYITFPLVFIIFKKKKFRHSVITRKLVSMAPTLVIVYSNCFRKCCLKAWLLIAILWNSWISSVLQLKQIKRTLYMKLL